MEPIQEQKKDIKQQIAIIEKRRKRIQRMKRTMMVLLCVFLLFPNLSSIYLLIQNYRVNVQLRQITDLLTNETVGTASPEYSYAEDNASKENVLTAFETDPYPIPDSERYPDKKRVYLTFDDGPSKYTNEILDILAEYDVKATFFVLAKDGYESEYKRIVAEGHTLAIHSYSHKYSTIYATPTAFREDVRLVSDFIYEVTGERTSYYRFPGGSSNNLVEFDKEELFKVLREEELAYFDWNVASEDAGSVKLAPERIAQNVLEGTKDKQCGVVLLHDAADKHTTVESLPLILDALTKDEEYIVLPITEGTERVRHVVSAYE